MKKQQALSIRDKIRSRLASMVLLLTMVVVAVSSLPQVASGDASLLFPQDASKGWKLFLSKNCIRCHTIWGQGDASIGPDLGRIHIAHLSEGQLATNIVNHLPVMWEKMQEEGVRYPTITPEEMGQLFSFLYFIRYVDEPGDPAAGKNLLSVKGCTNCHSILGEGGKIGPDLTSWGVYINPIVWAQKMWTHAPQMEEAMHKQGMTWPTLNAKEIIDLVAYIQSIGGKIQDAYHLEPGSPERGKGLFDEKGCHECHTVEGIGAKLGPDFGKIDFPRTLGGMAALMWNHSPDMMKMMKMRGVERKDINPQEMADILAYLFAVRFFDEPGNPVTGAKVFEEKNCVICHSVGPGGRDGSVGPNLGRLRSISTITLTQSIWNHGPQMMQKMRDYGFSWPVLKGSDMKDIVAYLQTKSAQK